MANTLNWSKWVKMGCHYEIAMCAKKDEVDAGLLLKTVEEDTEDLLKDLASEGKTITVKDDFYYFYVVRDYSSYGYQFELSRQLDTLSKAIPSFEAIFTNEENDTSTYKGIKSKHLLDYYSETTFSYTFNGIEEEDF